MHVVHLTFAEDENMQKHLLPATWTPDEVNAMRQGYEMAVKTLETHGPISQRKKNELAREILALAQQGCLDARRLATRSIVRIL